MEEYNKSFKHWKTQEVEEVFGIEPAKDNSRLENWLKATCPISEEEKRQLEVLQKRLLSRVSYWNEAAIQFYFIGPLIGMVDYDRGRYNSFLEQKVSLKINKNLTIIGNVDFLVATGKQIPRLPFFTLHEYKPEPNVSADPRGQLLISMIAAQKQNQAKDINAPLYGVYTMGRFWFFVLLEGKTYSESLAYDATQEELFDIFCILKKVKEYIDIQVGN